MTLDSNEISRTLLERVRQASGPPGLQEVGTVAQICDGIARVYGLAGCMAGELLEFDSGDLGMALNLEEDNVGCVLLTAGFDVCSGMQVKRTGKTTTVAVGPGLLGRVVSPLSEPLDGLGPIRSEKRRPVEAAATGVTQRKPVNEPLQTGILAIDSMIPIGRGQRQLIIGDRQTGKTAIALDAIINQRGKNVVCVYVAIGQKASVITNVVNTLAKYGAMEHTVVVASTSADSAPLQYLAPYAGCAIAEEFMFRGEDALIVYDDLSKHAVAYRTMSLLLKRPPGREAYPGDVFYLHSKLLERAAHLSDGLGGGSVTALPIIETLSGDISAYIPTNVISITDGQIFLETELFHSGFRPAINVGLSVSRVGGTAQKKAMKKAATGMRIGLAQYRELQVFSQLGSDLDAATQARLNHGARLMDTIKQRQYTPMPMEEQVAVLYCAKNGYLADIPFYEVERFNQGLLAYLKEHEPSVLGDIRDSGDFTPETEEKLKAAADRYASAGKGKKS